MPNHTGPSPRPPLEGIRVLDLTSKLPGAYATGVLADLGAEVIKIEPPDARGDMRAQTPRFGSESVISWVVDRGKRAVTLDLKDERGVAALKALVRSADCLLETFRPGTVERLGIGYEELKRENPALVFCSLSGYGQNGPLARVPGHDLSYQGRSGAISLTGPSEAEPAVPGVAISDLAGGCLAAVGMVSSVMAARASGEGERIDLAMADTLFWWLGFRAVAAPVRGDEPDWESIILSGTIPCFNVYACGDGKHITVAAVEPKFFEILCDLIGRPDLVETHMDAAALPRWREIFLTRTSAEWLDLLETSDACVGPVNEIEEAGGDPQFLAREMMIEQEHPSGGMVGQLGLPLKLERRPCRIAGPAPRRGANTRECLLAAGLTDESITELVRDGVAQEPTE